MVTSVIPGHTFSSVALSWDVQSPIHRDSHSHTRVCSAIIPAGQWQSGGELRIADESTDTILQGKHGNLRPLWRYLLLDSTADHATMPWTGTRVVILAWHVWRGWRADDLPRSTLQNLRFPCWAREWTDNLSCLTDGMPDAPSI